MTVLELIDAAAERLTAASVSFGHGTTNAFDEAAWLVLWRLGLPLDVHLEGPDSIADQEVTAHRSQEVEALLERRIASRLPAAYLTQEAWLQGVPFHVDERVIVPRSLIAELITDGALDYWLPAGSQRLLDLCTGGGSLAILAALAWPELAVDACDISPGALAVAAINLKRHELAGRIRLAQGDGLAAVSGMFDMILCNPPYVNARSMQQLPAEYRAEPPLALAGGPDGMDLVRRLIPAAPARLSEHAALVLEIGNERPHFEAAFPQLEAVWLDTSAGDEQVCVLTRAALAAHLQRGRVPDLPASPPSPT